MSEENKGGVGVYILIILLISAILGSNSFNFSGSSLILRFLEILKFLSIVGIIISVILILTTFLKILNSNINLGFLRSSYEKYKYYSKSFEYNKETISELFHRVNVIDGILKKNGEIITEALQMEPKSYTQNNQNNNITTINENNI